MHNYDFILNKALEAWGSDAQKKMAIEECSELIKALCKEWRKSSPDGTIENTIDEIADVTIMMRQLSLLYGTDLVNKKIQEKIERLKGRLGLTDSDLYYTREIPYYLLNSTHPLDEKNRNMNMYCDVWYYAAKNGKMGKQIGNCREIPEDATHIVEVHK